MLYSKKFYQKKKRVFYPSCGSSNLDSAKFCTKCGTALNMDNSDVVKESGQGRLNQYKSSSKTNKPNSTQTVGSGFKRAKRGGMIFGICKGLENAGRGSTTMWRFILVLVSLFLTGIPVIIYIIAGLMLPVSDD